MTIIENYSWIKISIYLNHTNTQFVRNNYTRFWSRSSKKLFDKYKSRFCQLANFWRESGEKLCLWQLSLVRTKFPILLEKNWFLTFVRRCHIFTIKSQQKYYYFNIITEYMHISMNSTWAKSRKPCVLMYSEVSFSELLP